MLIIRLLRLRLRIRLRLPILTLDYFTVLLLMHFLATSFLLKSPHCQAPANFSRLCLALPQSRGFVSHCRSRREIGDVCLGRGGTAL